jgi:hypothetical protein
LVKQYATKRVLITVRTYPTPAKKGVEVSCTAGVTDDGDWIRLFPIPYRRMAPEKQFKKYQWIDLDVTKARGDTRPESYTPDLDSIQIVGQVSTKRKWQERKELLDPIRAHCLCCLERQRKENSYPTLGFFRPAEIKRLAIQPDDPEWSPQQLARLRQTSLFDREPPAELQKIPFKFSYEFSCPEDECRGHTMSCTDWEMSEAYRRWRRGYGDGWEKAFRQKFEHEMIELNDTHFYVGTLHGYPGTWIIVGLFYPRLE